MAHLLLYGICALIDECMMVWLPNSYLVDSLLFIPNLAFCAMILTLRQFRWLDKCLFAFGCGMIYDFCFANEFLLYAVVYVIVVCLLQLWSKHMTDTIFESFVLCIMTIFVKDLLVYCYMSFHRLTYLSLIDWAQRYELLTLLGNGILVVVLVVFIRMKDDYLKMKASRIRKGEKLEWFKLKSKE